MPRRRFRRRTRLLVGLVVAALGAGGFAVYANAGANPGCSVPRDTGDCARVFFLGNSYTAVNDLPYTFVALAWAGGHRVDTAVIAPGGWTLADHAGDPDTRTTLAGSHWDWVVLQEQSEIPAVEVDRKTLMEPAARELGVMAVGAGAKPMLLETWAHRNGWPAAGLSDYDSMQAAIDAAYESVAAEQHVPLAPAGRAWAEVVTEDPNPGLWQGDGSHPTAKGTYLAACVLYAAIFGKSPVGLGYHTWISGADAQEVQRAAADTVFGLPTAAGAS